MLLNLLILIWHVTGVFFVNADIFLVLATNELISSEFDDLADADWLATSYGLAMCAVQPLVGFQQLLYEEPLLTFLIVW